MAYLLILRAKKLPLGGRIADTLKHTDKRHIHAPARAFFVGNIKCSVVEGHRKAARCVIGCGFPAFGFPPLGFDHVPVNTPFTNFPLNSPVFRLFSANSSNTASLLAFTLPTMLMYSPTFSYKYCPEMLPAFSVRVRRIARFLPMKPAYSLRCEGV